MADPSSQLPADISVWIERLDATPPAAGRLSSPDLLQQLKQTLRRPVNRAVCLETDIDPACDLLRRFAAEHREDLIRGLAVLKQLLGGVRPVRVTERSPRQLERTYPHLLPPLLTKQLFGRTVRMHRRPTDVGVLVLDAIDAAHLGAMADGRPPAPLPVIIDDLERGQRVRLAATAGERVADVLARCAIRTAGRLLRHGSPAAMSDLPDWQSIGTTQLWLHLSAVETCVTSPLPLGCTRVGTCLSVCPVRLNPAALLEARQRGDVAMAERFSLGACVECGLCSAACPSHLPLLPAIRHLKRVTP